MSNKLEKLAAAPDFEMKDCQGNLVRLSEKVQHGPVVLVLNRGFI
jgi:hypothetical protein